MPVRFADVELSWHGYATLRIEWADGPVAYLDPGRYGVLTGEWEPDTDGVAHPPATDFAPHDADLVCVTHDHHYDPDGIRRVAREDTTVVVCEGINTHRIDRVAERPVDLPQEVVEVDTEADRLFADTVVRTVPAYNDPEGPHVRENGQPYHPKGRGCGFLLTHGDTTVFWTGDTDVLDGHAELDVDVLVPPIGGTFTMDRHEAADLAGAMEPGLVLPIHYNTFGALETDSGAFAADVAGRGIPVVLDET
jgi:L-ascorbate metabolism protein UlaG (beta-lactamase superfamily)